jgi:hypothetical protein
MLHKKYLPLFKKMQFQLIKLAQENGLALDAEDYLGETYDSFLNSVYTMRFDEEKIQLYKHRWGLWCCLKRYLMSRNRDIMKKVLEQNAHEVLLDSNNKEDKEDHIFSGIALVGSTEDDYIKKEENNLFWEAVNQTLERLTPLQIKIFESLYSGEKNSIIMKNLNLCYQDFKIHLAIVQKTIQENFYFKTKINNIFKIKPVLNI